MQLIQRLRLRPFELLVALVTLGAVSIMLLLLHETLRGFEKQAVRGRALLLRAYAETVATELRHSMTSADSIDFASMLAATDARLRGRFFEDIETRGLVVRAIRGAPPAARFYSPAVGDAPVSEEWYVSVEDQDHWVERWADRILVVNWSIGLLMGASTLVACVVALRAARRALSLADAKGRLLANVSHDLRTPLASIAAFGELLRLGWVKEGEPTRDTGALVERQARQLQRMVDRLLAVARLERRIQHQRSRVDLAAVAKDAVDLRRLDPDAQSIAFTISARPGAPLCVSADRDALYQAIFNLVDNAVKYGGGPAIAIEVTGEGNEVQIAVSDTGRGLATNEQLGLFERFQRGDSTQVSGSGLGLAIVKEVAESHNGRVCVDSTVGRGSTFTMILPAAAGSLNEL